MSDHIVEGGSTRRRASAQTRSQSMVLAGYFLSRMGRTNGDPPLILEVKHWHEAYELFRPACGEGRGAKAFGSSLKNTRDAFDSHLPGPRVGWLDAGGPGRLSVVEAHVLEGWASRSDEELAEAMEELLTRHIGDLVEESETGDGGLSQLVEGLVLIPAKPRGPGAEAGFKSARKAGRERQIGDLAEVLVRNHLIETLGPKEGASVIHHAAIGETPGYDLSYVQHGVRSCVEVKGTVGPTMGSFAITRKEWMAAVENGPRYSLYLVSGVEGANPKFQILTDPASPNNQLEREPTVWQVTLR